MSKYGQLYEQAGKQYDIDPNVLRAVAQTESGENPNIHRSKAGAIGMMQFMPETAKALGVNPYDPESSVNGAAKLLSQLRKRYGNMPDALRAYNAGTDRTHWNNDETRAYVPKVVQNYRNNMMQREHTIPVPPEPQQQQAPQSAQLQQAQGPSTTDSYIDSFDNNGSSDNTPQTQKKTDSGVDSYIDSFDNTPDSTKTTTTAATPIQSNPNDPANMLPTNARDIEKAIEDASNEAGATGLQYLSKGINTIGGSKILAGTSLSPENLEKARELQIEQHKNDKYFNGATEVGHALGIAGNAWLTSRLLAAIGAGAEGAALVGEGLTGGANLATRGLQGAASFLRGSGLNSAGKAMAYGAATGGTEAALQGEKSSDVAKDTALGGAFGAGGHVLASEVSKGYNALKGLINDSRGATAEDIRPSSNASNTQETTNTNSTPSSTPTPESTESTPTPESTPTAQEHEEIAEKLGDEHAETIDNHVKAQSMHDESQAQVNQAEENLEHQKQEAIRNSYTSSEPSAKGVADAVNDLKDALNRHAETLQNLNDARTIEQEARAKVDNHMASRPEPAENSQEQTAAPEEDSPPVSGRNPNVKQVKVGFGRNNKTAENVAETIMKNALDGGPVHLFESKVPGVHLTTAMATRNGDLAAYERAARAQNPQKFQYIDHDNNEALRNHLFSEGEGRFATSAQLDDLIKKHGEFGATTPGVFADQQPVSTAPVLDHLNEMIENNKGSVGVTAPLEHLQKVITDLHEPESQTIEPNVLWNVSKHARDMILSKDNTAFPSGKTAASQLRSIRGTIADQVQEGTGQKFKEYMREYARQAQEIEASQLLHKHGLTDGTETSEGTLQLAKIKSLIKKVKDAKGKPGSEYRSITPEQLKRLQDVYETKELTSAPLDNRKNGGPGGPDTAGRLFTNSKWKSMANNIFHSSLPASTIEGLGYVSGLTHILPGMVHSGAAFATSRAAMKAAQREAAFEEMVDSHLKNKIINLREVKSLSTPRRRRRGVDNLRN